MKSKITKIWSVGLVVVLATSLILFAAPVSAGTLSWTTETIPSTTGNRLTTGNAIADIAAAYDGTLYLVTGTDNKTYKSTNGGVTWAKLSKTFTFTPDLVAVAPDDSDVVAIADTTGFAVWVSTNGGSTWGTLSTPSQTGGAGNADAINDIAISPTDAGTNYVGVAGAIGASGNAWYFNIGAAAPAWKETRLKDGVAAGFSATTTTTIEAVAFSPNFASDKVMVVVSGVASAEFQMFSTSTRQWNVNAGFGSYPVTIQNAGTNITDLTTASISLSPEYLGSDDTLRVAFVGISTGAGTDGGIYRIKDTTDKQLDVGNNIHSIAYDGTNLVAGRATGNVVRRSTDPLATTPSFGSAASLKRPGISTNNLTVVAWNGADVVAGTTGNGSAFAVSRDDAKSFNDISLINTAAGNLGNMDDVAVSADGSIVYMLSRDANALSLWRNAGAWERVFGIPTATGYILRLAPEDPDAVYLALTGGTTVYFSSSGGDTKWFTRTSRYSIADLAVESAGVAYIGVSGEGTISKTTNSGFTWGSSKSAAITGNIFTLKSISEDNVVAGSTQSDVSYSTDGGSTWTGITPTLQGSGSVQVTASGLANEDYIYAATSVSGQRVERWQIGVSSTSWKDLSAPLTTRSVTGIALVSGVLYAATDNTTTHFTLRTLSPTSSEPSSGMWSAVESAGSRFTATPSALRVSTGSTKLWAVNTATPSLFSYTDTLADTAPTLSAPGDAFALAMNPVSGAAFAVTFTIERPSKGKIYDVQVATDSGFTEKVVNDTISSTTSSTPSYFVAGGIFMPATTYYWRVRVNIAGPVRSPWSEVRTFTVAELDVAPPVVIKQIPPPVITIPPAPPPPQITITPPDIILPPPPPPPPEIVIPPAPAPPAPITPAYIWAIIIIGAILVIALIVLIVRTRRPV